MNFRTRSGGSLPRSSSRAPDVHSLNMDFKITDDQKSELMMAESETGSLANDWNPALLNHETESLDGQSLQSPAYMFDSNSVILRNDNVPAVVAELFDHGLDYEDTTVNSTSSHFLDFLF